MNHEIIHEITKDTLINPYKMSLGTKYRNFIVSKDLKVGNYVYASKFAGKEIGEITKLIDSEYCEINNKLTFVSDIMYIKIQDNICKTCACKNRSEEECSKFCPHIE